MSSERWPNGKPGRKHPPPEQRFWAKVQKSDGCWLWTGSLSGEGYGNFSVSGQYHLAHRYAMALAGHELVPSIKVLHKCDINYAKGDVTYRRCVNPAHLFIGTDHDNARDCRSKGRSSGAKLTPGQVNAIQREYADGADKKALAEKYGVSYWAIHFIINGRTWSGVKRNYPKPEGGEWLVLRHGGRRGDEWRAAAWGDETGARRMYAKMKSEMKQGGLQLHDPDGKAHEHHFLPPKRPGAFKRAS